jgi:hypothetical protein
MENIGMSSEGFEENSPRVNEYLKGRGAQINTKNRFLKNERVREHVEGIDDWTESNDARQYIEQEVKSIVNKVDSPDVGMFYSMNPPGLWQLYILLCKECARYWGYSAGLDFERKIVVKKNALEILRKFLMNPKWECVPISISGNTDCYQPAEQHYRITVSCWKSARIQPAVGMIPEWRHAARQGHPQKNGSKESRVGPGFDHLTR